MKKRKTKAGARKKDDKKVLVGAYILQSEVDKYGGIEEARAMATEMLRDNAALEGKGHITL